MEIFSLFNGCNTGFYFSDISKNSNHGDMLRTNAFQIKDADVSGFFSHIRSSDHIHDFTLNEPYSSKRDLIFGEDLLTDGSHPLPQKFKDSGGRVGYYAHTKCHD